MQRRESMESNVLSELELRVLRESRGKSIKEAAKALGMSEEETKRILEVAREKLSISTSTEPITEPVLPTPRYFRLRKKIGQPQIGLMKVGSKIVEILGKGVYSAPWNSLKELISNSFDASATRVDMQYFPEEGRLVVTDDGLGMDYIDFDEHFTFITQSEKRRKSDLSAEHERPIIGKYGIGFIAVSQLCNKIRVTSAKKGADTYFVATIDYAKLRREEARDKEFYQVSQYVLINYEKKDLDKHYTQVELLDLKKTFTDVLDNVVPAGVYPIHLKPKSFEDVMNELCSGEIGSIRREAGPFWEFLVSLANVIPVEYLDDGPVSFSQKITIEEKHLKGYNSTMTIINDIKSRMKKYNFRVFFNGLQLKKPVRFPNEEWLIDYDEQLRIFPVANSIEVVDPITGNASKIIYKGFFYYQKTRIVPEELRGMVVRVRNVAIGGPNRDLWGHPYPGDKLYFDQVYGEVYVESGLEDAMNIDRSTFKTTHFEYAAMRDLLHQFLHQGVFATAKSMWYTRRKSKARKMKDLMLAARRDGVKEALGSDFSIEETRRYTEIPVQIKKEEKKIYLNVLSRAFWDFKKNDRILLEDVAIALEIAMLKEKDPEKVKKLFWQTLKQLTGYR